MEECISFAYPGFFYCCWLVWGTVGHSYTEEGLKINHIPYSGRLPGNLILFWMRSLGIISLCLMHLYHCVLSMISTATERIPALWPLLLILNLTWSGQVFGPYCSKSLPTEIVYFIFLSAHHNLNILLKIKPKKTQNQTKNPTQHINRRFCLRYWKKNQPEGKTYFFFSWRKTKEGRWFTLTQNQLLGWTSFKKWTSHCKIGQDLNLLHLAAATTLPVLDTKQLELQGDLLSI